MAEIRIYLAEQPVPNFGKYEIYREGKPTGEIITASTVQKILTREQYIEFLNGQDIFLIQGEVFRKRNFKNPKKNNRKIDL